MKSERTLSAEEAHEVAEYGRSACSILGIDFDGRADDVVAAIDAYVDEWPRRDAAQVRSDLADAQEIIHLAWAVGALWGHVIVQRFDWQWVAFDEGDFDRYAVVSRDRALAVCPADFVRECFYDASRDFTALLMFNMLVADQFAGFEPNGLSDLSKVVTRIVPRRSRPLSTLSGYRARAQTSP